ncbi:MAG: SUMF1/EgtB/PvdO family nonheme iron enzyme, partial [Candidatus Latescibacteria bacterium]|nr:SUMF1/EgtB/PvdO family nonheme iron enzyme [Candidatus Latescibacterota bacterium]
MIYKTAVVSLIVTLMFAVASCSKVESTRFMETSKPKVSIITPMDGKQRFGVVDVKVEASDDAGIARVELFVNNKKYGADTTDPYIFEWDMDASTLNEFTLYAKAYDNNGNAERTDTITVPKGVTAFPVAILTGPAEGTTIAQGDVLTLSGTATDAEDGELSDGNITWSSNQQGVLGQKKTLEYSGLVVADHIITMTATDSNGMTNETSVKVTVTENNLPYAVIAPGTYYIGQPVFPKSIVLFEKKLHVSKTELSVQEFCELFLDVEGSARDLKKWADRRNKELYNDSKYPAVGYYLKLFDYENEEFDPVKMVYGDYPVCFISLKEAIAVCNAKSDKDGYERAYIYLDGKGLPVDDYDKTRSIEYVKEADGWRFLTEAEWEIAARGGLTGKKYPWGDYGPGGLCNSMSAPSLPDVLDLYNGRGLCPVDSFEPNKYGLYNTAGNVAEMCSDMFVMGYSYSRLPPTGTDPCKFDVITKLPRYLLKGGAWYEFGNSMQISMSHLTIPLN